MVPLPRCTGFGFRVWGGWAMRPRSTSSSTDGPRLASSSSSYSSYSAYSLPRCTGETHAVSGAYAASRPARLCGGTNTWGAGCRQCAPGGPGVANVHNPVHW
eukprot:363864-Chlamydomonas_euryale.AAC.2